MEDCLRLILVYFQKPDTMLFGPFVKVTLVIQCISGKRIHAYSQYSEILQL